MLLKDALLAYPVGLTFLYTLFSSVLYFLLTKVFKDIAFPLTERDRLGLRGLLPPRVISFEQQHQRFMFGMGPSNPANMIAMQQQQQGGFGNIQTHTQNLQSGMVNLPNTTQNANFPQQRQQNQS